MCPGLIRRNGSSTGNVTAARTLLQCRPWFDLLGFHSLDLCNFWVSIMKPHGSLGLGERCGGQLRSDEGGLHLCLWDVPCSLVPGCSPSWWLWSYLAGRLEFNRVPPISWLVATCMINIFVKNSNNIKINFLYMYVLYFFKQMGNVACSPFFGFLLREPWSTPLHSWTSTRSSTGPKVERNWFGYLACFYW